MLRSSCLCVCPSARVSQKPHVKPNDIFCSPYVASGRGTVLLWRQCSMLHISDFLDDVMFSHNWGSLKTT